MDKNGVDAIIAEVKSLKRKVAELEGKTSDEKAADLEARIATLEGKLKKLDEADLVDDLFADDDD